MATLRGFGSDLHFGGNIAIVLADGVFEAFVAAVPAGAASELAAARPDVEAAIETALQAGSAQWPDIAVDAPAFAAAMGRSFGDGASALGELHAADLYLAQACASGDPRAVVAFDRTFSSVIASSLRAMRLTDDAAADTAQDVREKLFVATEGGPGKIATYSGRAALASWLRTIATRTAIAAMRQRTDNPIDDDELDALPGSNDTPDQQYFRATYHVEFKAAFDAALASLTDQQRDLLRLRFVEGLPLEAIGERYNVHKTTSFRWLQEAQTLLTKRTHNNFQQRTRATVSEMRSIVRVLESNVELSLRRVLAR
ncbi:MAG TPA: sigma-70 family RNA polymerase sigma factor [Kofleriaceae bacterium]|jgi:RNA polymerase sigma-70 factor (ECF subfamily)